MHTVWLVFLGGIIFRGKSKEGSTINFRDCCTVMPTEILYCLYLSLIFIGGNFCDCRVNHENHEN